MTSAVRPPQFILAAIIAMIACPARGEDGVQIEADVVYGHKVGMALTYDVIRPEKDANGKGILFMVSGGWFSPWFPPEAVMGRAGLPSTTLKALVDRGFTLFLVRHGSGEKFLVPDAVDDVRRAALHVRRHAERYEVEPERLGVVGMSAGGHLSLMLGTTAAKVEARPGEQADDAPDKPVVAAVVAFFPPTDLHDYVTDEKFRRQFPALQFDASLAASVSPLKHVTSDDAPALMIHGTKDDLVPIKHSHDMHEALKASGVEANVLVIDEAGHGFQGEDELRATKATVDWFAEHLLAGETEATQP